jgi:hypothetical protein
MNLSGTRIGLSGTHIGKYEKICRFSPKQHAGYFRIGVPVISDLGAGSDRNMQYL